MPDGDGRRADDVPSYCGGLMTRNGTPLQRLRERGRRVVSPERVQYLQQRGLEQTADFAVHEAGVARDEAQVADDRADAAQDDADQALLDAGAALTAAGDAEDLAQEASEDAAAALLAVDGLADGTTPHTALNVAGVNVAPFLGKTDGTKLTDAAGLDAGVVDTPAIAAAAVTVPDVAFTSGSMSIQGSGETTIQTLSVTVLAGERVDLMGAAAISALGKDGSLGQLMGTITMKLKRGSTVVASAKCAPVVHGITIPVQAALPWSDTPGAGTFTYTLVTEHSNAGNTSSSTAESRYLSAVRVKR